MPEYSWQNLWTKT